MKKLVLIVALIVVAISAQARGAYFGGVVGLSLESSTKAEKYSFKIGLSVEPEIGYNITDNFAIGASVGAGFNLDGGDANTLLGITPYLRYTFFEAGPVKFFGEGAFTFDSAATEYGIDKGWGVAVRPGMLVRITSRLHLLGRMTVLRYSEAGKGENKIREGGLTISDAISLGVQINF